MFIVGLVSIFNCYGHGAIGARVQCGYDFTVDKGLYADDAALVNELRTANTSPAPEPGALGAQPEPEIAARGGQQGESHEASAAGTEGFEQRES